MVPKVQHLVMDDPMVDLSQCYIRIEEGPGKFLFLFDRVRFYQRVTLNHIQGIVPEYPPWNRAQ